jgi:hypothetical protein
VAKAKVLKVLKVLNFSGAGEPVLWRWGWECKVGGGRYLRTARVLVVTDPLSDRASIYIDEFNLYHGCFDDHRNRPHWRHNRWFDSALITRNRARRRRIVPLDRASPMPRRCRLVSSTDAARQLVVVHRNMRPSDYASRRAPTLEDTVDPS